MGCIVTHRLLCNVNIVISRRAGSFKGFSAISFIVYVEFLLYVLLNTGGWRSEIIHVRFITGI